MQISAKPAPVVARRYARSTPRHPSQYRDATLSVVKTRIFWHRYLVVETPPKRTSPKTSEEPEVATRGDDSRESTLGGQTHETQMTPRPQLRVQSPASFVSRYIADPESSNHPGGDGHQEESPKETGPPVGGPVKRRECRSDPLEDQSHVVASKPEGIRHE